MFPLDKKNQLQNKAGLDLSPAFTTIINPEFIGGNELQPECINKSSKSACGCRDACSK